MPVEQHDPLAGDLQCVLEHKARDFLKGTIDGQNDYGYLLFAGGDAVRVELAKLEVREEELGRGSRIAVGC